MRRIAGIKLEEQDHESWDNHQFTARKKKCGS